MESSQRKIEITSFVVKFRSRPPLLSISRCMSFTFRCIDDVLLLNNSRFCDFVDRIYHIELKIKDTADTDRSASFIDLHLEIDSEGR
jgi:hypothetical protein